MDEEEEDDEGRDKTAVSLQERAPVKDSPEKEANKTKEEGEEEESEGVDEDLRDGEI